jgi:hypothetical protein
MNPELKKAILNFVLENDKEFQINNMTIDKFRPYTYCSEGDYLIGGQDVSKFIENAIKLLKN